ncbi:MAG: hypothetical protein ACKVYV_17755 [Limisphaerales bacterium]
MLRRPFLAGIHLVAAFAAGAAEPLFNADFSAAEIGSVPDGMLVLDGQFAVREAEGGRELELPGAPLDSFGLLWGPAKKEDVTATARFFGTGQGRRFPVFGLSLNGVAGYRVQVVPAKKAVEILKGDEIKATAPFTWPSGAWTRLRVQVRKVGDAEWIIEGRAWADGTEEPRTWTITWKETTPPIAGRAAVWGQPFSGTPIRFDDLRLEAVQP